MAYFVGPEVGLGALLSLLAMLDTVIGVLVIWVIGSSGASSVLI